MESGNSIRKFIEKGSTGVANFVKNKYVTASLLVALGGPIVDEVYGQDQQLEKIQQKSGNSNVEKKADYKNFLKKNKALILEKIDYLDITDVQKNEDGGFTFSMDIEGKNINYPVSEDSFVDIMKKTKGSYSIFNYSRGNNSLSIPVPGKWVELKLNQDQYNKILDIKSIQEKINQNFRSLNFSASIIKNESAYGMYEMQVENRRISVSISKESYDLMIRNCKDKLEKQEITFPRLYSKDRVIGFMSNRGGSTIQMEVSDEEYFDAVDAQQNGLIQMAEKYPFSLSLKREGNSTESKYVGDIRYLKDRKHFSCLVTKETHKRIMEGNVVKEIISNDRIEHTSIEGEYKKYVYNVQGMTFYIEIKTDQNHNTLFEENADYFLSNLSQSEHVEINLKDSVFYSFFEGKGYRLHLNRKNLSRLLEAANSIFGNKVRKCHDNVNYSLRDLYKDNKAYHFVEYNNYGDNSDQKKFNLVYEIQKEKFDEFRERQKKESERLLMTQLERGPMTIYLQEENGKIVHKANINGSLLVVPKNIVELNNNKIKEFYIRNNWAENAWGSSISSFPNQRATYKIHGYPVDHNTFYDIFYSSFSDEEKTKLREMEEDLEIELGEKDQDGQKEYYKSMLLHGKEVKIPINYDEYQRIIGRIDDKETTDTIIKRILYLLFFSGFGVGGKILLKKQKQRKLKNMQTGELRSLVEGQIDIVDDIVVVQEEDVDYDFVHMEKNEKMTLRATLEDKKGNIDSMIAKVTQAQKTIKEVRRANTNIGIDLPQDLELKLGILKSNRTIVARSLSNLIESMKTSAYTKINMTDNSKTDSEKLANRKKLLPGLIAESKNPSLIVTEKRNKNQAIKRMKKEMKGLGYTGDFSEFDYIDEGKQKTRGISSFGGDDSFIVTTSKPEEENKYPGHDEFFAGLDRSTKKFIDKKAYLYKSEILQAIRDVQNNSVWDKGYDIKKLQARTNEYRVRIGGFRILFQKNGITSFLKIDDRDDVYKDKS